MVNASDAAALAAAQSCIGAGENEEASRTSSPPRMWTASSVSGNITAQRNCHEG
jgi:hypothetical protein